MSWGLFRDAREEQQQWRKLHVEQTRRKSARSKMTPEIAARVAAIHKKYPWVSPGLSLGLAGSNASDEVVKKAAMAMARQKGERSRWSQIGDVVRGAGRAVGGVAADVGGVIGDALPSATSRVGGSGLTPNQQRAGTDPSPVVRSVIRGASALAQTVQEAAVGEIRSTIASGEGPIDPLGIRHPSRSEEVASQTTLGAAVEGYRETGRVDLGHGFFAMGEAQKRQAANSRKVLSVDGHAWTPGRMVASTIFEEGTLPYQTLSGSIDMVASWKLDVPAKGAKAFGEAREAARTLSGIEGATQVARAAKKADPEWRRVVEEARGMVGGSRPTVVPRAVEKYLYSDEWKRLATRIADEPSPYEIWRASDKKWDPLLAQQLARSARDPETVTKVMRPYLGRGVLPGDVGGPVMKVTHDFQSQFRAFNIMPDTFLPFDDPPRFVRNLDNSLANAKVMGEKRRAIMDRAFDVLADPSAGKRKRLLDVASEAVTESLVAHGVDEDTAKQLSSWVQESDKIRRYLTDSGGRDLNYSWVEGDAPRPTDLMELLNSGTHLYDPKNIKKIRSLTRSVKVLNQKKFQVPKTAIDAFQQEIWKPAAVARPAYFLRVNGEETARALGSGAFDNTWDYVNFVASRGRGTAKGGLFDVYKEADDIAERLATETLDDVARSSLQSRLAELNDAADGAFDEYHESLVGEAWKHDTFEATERAMVRSGNWDVVSRSSQPRRWKQGLADETIMMSRSPIIKRVANGGILEGDKVPNARPGLDGIKDWLRDGAGRKFRKQLEDAFPGMDFTNEGVLDEVIEKAQIRLAKLGDNADLREAVATGRLNGKPIFTDTRTGPRNPSEELLDRLEDWRLDPASPEFQKYEQRAEDLLGTGQRAADEFLRYRDQFSTWFFGGLYGRTSDKLAGSPVFRAEYWNRMEQLMPYLDEASRAKVIANAEEWGKLGKKRVARLTERAETPPGELTLEEADNLARGWGLDKVRDTFYRATERSQFFDATRTLFPFGEALREVMGKWPKIVAGNPQVPRRMEQVIRGARGAGVFHRDETTGEEVYSFPLNGPLADHLGVGLEGSVAGLSLGTSVIPSLGPVGQLTMKEILPNIPETDFIRSMLFPYGEPDSVSAAIVPGGWAKFAAAWKGDENGPRIYANAYAEVLRQLVASGKYGTSREERKRLQDDARDRARIITGMRGLVQLVAPSAPRLTYKVDVKGGDAVSRLLVKDFASMMEAEDKGKIESAIGAFTNKYGDQAYIYMIGKTKSQVGGQKVSGAYGEWERKNGGFIAKYGEVAGYFGPQEEGYDSAVFQRQVNDGKRKYRTDDEMLADAQSLLAGWMYRRLQEQMPANPSDAQREWLKAQKAKIKNALPEWNPEAQPRNMTKNIGLLQQAARDEEVRTTEIGQALKVYFQMRQQVIDAAKKRGVTGWDRANATADLREWLRHNANELAKAAPKFRGVWNDLLSHEWAEEEAA